VLTILTSGLVIAGLYFGRDIFVPFALAVLLSFLLAPAVRWLRKLRLGRVPAVGASVILAFIAIFGFGAIVAEEVASLGRDLPQYQHNIQEKIRSLHGVIPSGRMVERVSAILGDLRNELAKTINSPSGNSPSGNSSSGQPNRPTRIGTGSIPSEPTKPLPVEIRQPDPAALQIVQSVIGPLIQPLVTSGLVIVFVIFILLRREDLRDRLIRLAGTRDLHRTTEAMNDAAQRVSRYLSLQLVVNIAFGLPIGLGLAVIGIPTAALWGMMAVLLRFVPYLGTFIAAVFPLALAVAVDPGWSLLAWTAGLFIAVELVISYIVEPWLYGVHTGLSPVAIIAAATFWTWLWGPVGLLLSTPLTVCLVVLGRNVPQLKFLDVVLGNQPALAPAETFYQRMLANDPDEATEQAEEFAKDRSLAEFFDEVAIPALAMAQADSDRGALPGDRRAVVKAVLTAVLDNLSDSGASETTEPDAAEPRPIVVACVAGRNELDEAAAALLEHLLHDRGYAARAISADALASENLQRAALGDADAVCLSLISTNSPARARYLARRLRRRAPRAKLLVGFWGLERAASSASEMANATSAEMIATSLREAVTAIQTTFAAADLSGPLVGSQLPQPEATERCADEPASLMPLPVPRPA
jgi:predicted PurR-regulated permease PerM